MSIHASFAHCQVGMVNAERGSDPELSSSTRVLVVVPTLNEEAHIERVLTELLAGAEDDPTLSLHVVVADGGSRDQTCTLVEKFARSHRQVTLIHNRARLQSAAVNLAARRFGRDADVLIRCDAHAEYPPNYCSRLVETLRNTAADAVVVPLDSVGTAPLQRAIAWISNSPVGTGGSAHRAGRRSGFVDHGHHAAFRMAMFRAAGGYDPSFSHNEDAELDCRQRALGARIFLDSDLRVGYAPRKTLSALFHQYFMYGRGRSRTIRRHPRSLRLRQLAVPLHLALCGLFLALSAFQPWLLLWPALYVSALFAVALKFVVQYRSREGLLALPAALTMHTAWALGFFSGLARDRENRWGLHMVAPLPLRALTGGEP